MRTSRIVAKGRAHDEWQVFAAWNRRHLAWWIWEGFPEGDPSSWQRPQSINRRIAKTPAEAQRLVNLANRVTV